MASNQKCYPIGSVSTGTMRPEDLIPSFVAELYHSAKVSKANGHYRTIGDVPAKQRKEHVALTREIEARMESDDYYESDDASNDLDALFDALNCYAGPYFYFGAHPGDGSDYGYWLSDEWEQDFYDGSNGGGLDRESVDMKQGLIVNDLADVPKWWRGEVALVNDHGNVTLYVKTSRTLREIWSLV